MTNETPPRNRPATIGLVLVLFAYGLAGCAFAFLSSRFEALIEVVGVVGPFQAIGLIYIGLVWSATLMIFGTIGCLVSLSDEPKGLAIAGSVLGLCSLLPVIALIVGSTMSRLFSSVG